MKRVMGGGGGVTEDWSSTDERAGAGALPGSPGWIEVASGRFWTHSPAWSQETHFLGMKVRPAAA